MKAERISKILFEAGIKNYADSCNPGFTVHAEFNGNAYVFDAFDVSGPWEVRINKHYMLVDELTSESDLRKFINTLKSTVKS